MEADLYHNNTTGHVGVVKRDASDGRLKGANVRPGEDVFLTEEERVATAQAPRDPEDNPFVNGSLSLKAEGADVAGLRPISAPPLAPPEPEAAAPAPEPQTKPPAPQAPTPEPPAPPQPEAATVPPIKQPEDEAAKVEENAQEDEAAAARAAADERQRKQAEADARRRAERREKQAAQVETGAAADPLGDPPSGQRAASEEVATPEAPQQQRTD